MSKARDLANAGTALTTVSATELGYLDGVTSAVQTQLDAKAIPANVINNTLADAKGDLITATADNTPARLAVGSNGDTLVADSSTSTGLRYQGSMASGRNFVINGGMDIWQRGTSKLDGANSYHTADRWLLSSATAQTFSRQSVSDSTNLPFIQYCMRVQRTSGSTSTSAGNISQSFETVNSIPLAGKTVTLSFYARKGANYSATSSILQAQVLTGTGTDQNFYTAGYTGSVTAIDQNATLTTTWQRFSYTATLATNTNEIGVLFIGSPTGTAGAADYYEITGIQLEVGSVATQFTRQGGTIQGELAACQRYYFVKVAPGTNPATFGMASYIGGSDLRGTFGFPVEMRVTPTLVATSGTNYYTTELDADRFNSLTLNWTTKTEAGWFNSGDTASGTKGQASMVASFNALSSIALSAEL